MLLEKPLAKQVGGDIIEKKKTYLYLKAAVFHQEEAEELKRLLRSNLKTALIK
jgi:geranylgeranyl pyrophosphate synthase